MKRTVAVFALALELSAIAFRCHSGSPPHGRQSALLAKC
jgi:hypothetical protein